MTRFALIIGCPGIPDRPKYLPGVEFDIQNLYSFLLSPMGGAWQDNEILVLRNPDRETVKVIVANIIADYSLIYFSGHGYFKNHTYVGVSDGNISIRELQTICPRQMIIVDACRSFVPSQLSGFIGEQALTFPSSLTHQNARAQYDYYLGMSDLGIIEYYSCAPGEASRDSEAGGIFTLSLLESAINWVNTFGPHSILPINGAYYLTNHHLENNFITNQHPQMYGEKRQNWFPFALRLPLQWV